MSSTVVPWHHRLQPKKPTYKGADVKVTPSPPDSNAPRIPFGSFAQSSYKSCEREDSSSAASLLEPPLNQFADGELKNETNQAQYIAPGTLQAFLARYAHLDLSGKIYGIGPVTQSYGGYSDVYAGYIRSTCGKEMKVAVKRLRFHVINNVGFEKKLAKELYIWSKLSHPRILPLEGFFLGDNKYPSLVSKWIENGTVLKYLASHPSADVSHLVLGIAEGINYLHENGIVHSDIKPENILISDQGDSLICDFGVSRMLTTSRTFEFSTSLSAGVTGTLRYMSKELLSDSDQEPAQYSKASDVWSFGMTVLALLTKEPPYSHIRSDVRVLIAITRGDLPPRPPNMDDWPIQRQILWHICYFCWLDPLSRLTMPIITTGLRKAKVDHGSAGRQPRKESKAHAEAIRLLSHADPSGVFLRIFATDSSSKRAKESFIVALSRTTPPCQEYEGTPVFFASVAFRDTIQPGKFTLKGDLPFYVTYYHEEHSVRESGLLSVLNYIPEVMELVPASFGCIPGDRRPIVGGRDFGRGNLYHAVASHPIARVKIPGKTAEHLKGACIGYGQQASLISQDYEILCWKD